MNLRQVGGWALLVNALIGVLLTFESLISGSNTPAAVTIVQLVGFLLFIVGLPAIWVSQPQTGRAGQLGLVLMGLGSAIAFVVVLLFFAGSSVNSAVAWSSAVAGGVGSVLVGWLTVRARVFPAWIGWLLLASGVLNFITGYLPNGTFATIVDVVVGIALAAPIAGYGWVILNRSHVMHPQNAAA